MSFMATLTLSLLGPFAAALDERPCTIVTTQVITELPSMGRKPYLIPPGGSNVLGATSYVWAMKDLTEHLHEQQFNIDFIVFASSSVGMGADIVVDAGGTAVLSAFADKLV